MASFYKLINNRHYVIGFFQNIKNFFHTMIVIMLSKNLDFVCINDISLHEHEFNSERIVIEFIFEM